MDLVRGVQICSLSSFMFGWHVHEKAILMSVIPATILAFHGHHHKDRVLFFVLQYVGHYSLFPLLHDQFSIPLRFLLWSIYNLLSFNFVFTSQKGVLPQKENKIATLVTRCYLTSLLLCELLFIGVFPFTEYSATHEFLPLMMTSVVSAVGIFGCYVTSYKMMFDKMGESHKEKKEN